jgi:hypothetical protein
VQQTGGDGCCVHLEVCEDLGDLKWMNDVGLAGGAALALMLLLAEGPGCADEIEVVMRAIDANSREYALESGVQVLIELCRGGDGGECRGLEFGLGSRRCSESARGFVQGGRWLRGQWPRRNGR